MNTGKVRVSFTHKEDPHAPAWLTTYYKHDGRFYAMQNIYGKLFSRDEAQQAVEALAPEYPDYKIEIVGGLF